MKTQDFIDMEEEYGAHNYHPLDVVIERAEGVWVYDVEGKKAYATSLSASETFLEVSNAELQNGVYMYKVTCNSTLLQNGRLIIIK